MSQHPISRFLRLLSSRLRPSQKLRWTPEGVGYGLVWIILLATGLYQQINLVLLITGLAAGPIVASLLVSRATLRGLRLSRRAPSFVFSRDILAIDYQLENIKSFRDALAMTSVDSIVPEITGSKSGGTLTATVFFPRVPGRDRARSTWQTVAPSRGRYRFRSIDLITRSPFGLMERRETVEAPGTLLVYPEVGILTRQWRRVFREATETRRGRRHDRSSQQLEYHGLRDYRPGDSPRLIHWRTSARVGVPMVKEFEQQSEQDVAVLLDPWVPKSRPEPEIREALELSIKFAATVSMEICRNQGRRMLLGWAGSTPELRQGPASIRLLHELLSCLALMRGTSEGSLAELLDAVPAPMLREAMLIIVSTRSVNLGEVLSETRKLGDGSSIRLGGRTLVLDASRGDLESFLQFRSGNQVQPSRPTDDGKLTTSVEKTNPTQNPSTSSDGREDPSIRDRAIILEKPNSGPDRSIEDSPSLSTLQYEKEND